MLQYIILAHFITRFRSWQFGCCQICPDNVSSLWSKSKC